MDFSVQKSLRAEQKELLKGGTCCMGGQITAVITGENFLQECREPPRAATSRHGPPRAATGRHGPPRAATGTAAKGIL
jgi:hypothetical protein